MCVDGHHGQRCKYVQCYCKIKSWNGKNCTSHYVCPVVSWYIVVNKCMSSAFNVIVRIKISGLFSSCSKEILFHINQCLLSLVVCLLPKLAVTIDSASKQISSFQV